MGLLAAITRHDAADYLAALISVYSVLVIAWVLVSLVFSLGVRIPYNRLLNAVLDFLRDVVEPYLRIFRRFLPMFGPLDLSPLVALLVLQLLGSVVVSAVNG